MLAHRSLALLALVGATALAGCSASGSNKDSTNKFQGEQRLVANTVEDFQSAAQKGNGDERKICRELLSSELVAQLKSAAGSCEAAVQTALDDTDSFELEVQSVQISGTSATARVRADRGDRDRTYTLGLVKQGPGWRISDLAS